PAEDEPLPVGGREIAPNAQPLLWRAAGRNATRGGRGLGLDVVLALGRATVEGQRPAGLDRLCELFPRIYYARVRIAEFGRALQQHGLERVELVLQPGGRRVERDRGLALAEPDRHQRGAVGQIPGPEFQPDRDSAQFPVIELEARGELRAVVHMRSDA